MYRLCLNSEQWCAINSVCKLIINYLVITVFRLDVNVVCLFEQISNLKPENSPFSVTILYTESRINVNFKLKTYDKNIGTCN